jgi:hypothetical protein
MRFLTGLAGLAVIAAATHGNIMHLGGYQSEGAFLAIALSAALSIGTAAAVLAWRDQRALAIVLALCLIAGEAYWVAANAEREIAARELRASPAIDAAARYKAAQDRITKAETDKRLADEAAVSEAAKPGCKKECAGLLKDAKDRAATELEAARASFSGLTLPRSSAPLPELLGWAPWKWELLLACLKSAAVLAGSIMLALALHSKRVYQSPSGSELVGVSASPIVETKKPAPKLIEKPSPPSNVVKLPGGVVTFLARCTERVDGSNVSLNELFRSYKAWCAKSGSEPVGAEQFIKTVSAAFEKHGIKAEPDETGVICRGLRLSA